MEDKKRELTIHLLKNRILKYGEFTLKSGKKSWFYVDLRLITSFPETFEFVIECYLDLLKNLQEVDAFAGVAVAGIPFSSVIGFQTRKPSLIVRPEAKEHGRKKLVEGDIPKDSLVILIDDLITTGGSKIPGILALRKEGYQVEDLVVLIDRSQQTLNELEEHNINLHSFVTIEEIFRYSLSIDEKYITKKEKDLIRENFN